MWMKSSTSLKTSSPSLVRIVVSGLSGGSNMQRTVLLKYQPPTFVNTRPLIYKTMFARGYDAKVNYLINLHMLIGCMCATVK